MKWFINPFAVSGTKTPVPDDTQVGGEVSYEEGYGVDYARDPAVDPLFKRIERDFYNQILYDITEWCRTLHLQGTPNFITTAQNGGAAFSYGIGALCMYDAGAGLKRYESLISSNTSLPSVATDWRLLDTTPVLTTPAGAVMAFAMNTAPTGWIKANGAVVSRATYSALFTAIGTTFGVGDGSTTFGLPDMRGEFARGWDDARGIDTGRVFGSAQTDEFKAHTHSLTNAVGGNYIGGGGTISTGTTGGAAPLTTSTGGTETRPRNIALLYCIKT